METIFDFNPTEEELKKITLVPKEEYLRVFDDDSKALDNTWLFYLRGDNQRMHHYFNQIKNVDMRNSFKRTIYHPT